MKNIFLLLTLVAAAPLANAQFLKVGPKGGANLLKIDGQSFQDQFQVGYYAGGFAELRLGKNVYLMPEVLFAENNLRTTDDFESIYRDLLNVSTITNIKLQSLSIPISLNWKVANVLALSGGAQFSRNIEKGEGILKSAEAAITEGNVDLMAGVNFHLTKFRVNARYLWGVKDVNNIDKQDAWKKQAIQVGVGFVF